MRNITHGFYEVSGEAHAEQRVKTFDVFRCGGGIGCHNERGRNVGLTETTCDEREQEQDSGNPCIHLYRRSRLRTLTIFGRASYDGSYYDFSPSVPFRQIPDSLRRSFNLKVFLCEAAEQKSGAAHC